MKIGYELLIAFLAILSVLMDFSLFHYVVGLIILELVVVIVGSLNVNAIKKDTFGD
jgi:hypothetical protein